MSKSGNKDNYVPSKNESSPQEISRMTENAFAHQTQPRATVIEEKKDQGSQPDYKVTIINPKSQQKATNEYKFKNLILDMDETLIHATDKNLEMRIENTIMVKVETPPHSFMFRVYRRPYLADFLEEMYKHYNIYIYTAGHEKYANAILAAVGILPFIKKVFHRDYCNTISDNVQTKNIFKLGFDPRNTVFIDDYDLQIRHAPNNSILIKKFRGDTKDHELQLLIPFLKHMASAKDVRPLNQRLIEFFSNPLLDLEPSSINDLEDNGEISAEESKEFTTTGIQVRSFPSSVSQIKNTILKQGISSVVSVDGGMMRLRLTRPTLQSHNSDTAIHMPTFTLKANRSESEGDLPSFIANHKSTPSPSPLIEKISELNIQSEDTDELAI